MLTQDYIGLALVYLIIGITLSVALLLDKREVGIDTRKLIHIGVGNFVLVWWMFSSGWIMLTFFVLPFAVILFLAMFGNNIIGKGGLGTLTKDRGHSTGLFFYAMSIAFMVLFLFPDHWLSASIGIVAMTYGDGLGSVFGKRFGRHRLLGDKTLEGSFGVFLGTLISSLLLFELYAWLTISGHFVCDVTTSLPSWLICILAALLSSVTEALCPGKFDNLVIPTSTALFLVLLGL